MTFDPLRLRIVWNNQTPVSPFLGYRDLFVNPEPEYPFGRKGFMLQRAWEDIGVPNECVGMLLLDGDVAIDPHDNKMMHAHLYSDIDAVWVAPARIWPISHLGSGWVWGHGRDGKFTQDDVEDPDMFSFCFTFLPRDLIETAIKQGLEYWTYPVVDNSMWEVAKAMQIKVRIARECSPKHMHF